MNKPFEIQWHGAPTTGGSVVIGIFDGVHKGHELIIKKARENGEVVALTFYPHPAEILNPSAAPTELLPLNERINQLIASGVSSVAVLSFTKEFSEMSPQDFIDEIIKKTLDAKSITVGSNFRFGHKARGDVSYLKEFSGIAVTGLDLAVELGTSISSTRIREAITNGNIEIARELLTRPHVLIGNVIHGEKRGRTIGYPTANISLSKRSTIPSDGVYAGWLTVEGNKWPAAISIGTNPTFAGDRNRQVEAYALDQTNLDLYEKVARVEFGWRLRDTIKFDGLDPLLAQMKVDCEKARELTRN